MTVHRINIYQSDIDLLLGDGYISDHVIDSFLSIAQQGSTSAVILDSAFIGMNSLDMMTRWFTKLSAPTVHKLQQTKRLLIPACNRSEPEHWGLICLDIDNNNTGSIELYDSAISCGSLQARVQLIHYWAISMHAHSNFNTYWPKSWVCQNSKITNSAQQTDATSCGLFTCFNALLLSRGLSDFGWVSSVSPTRLRHAVYDSLRSKRIAISLPSE